MEIDILNEFLRDVKDLETFSGIGFACKRRKITKPRRRFNPLLDLDEIHFRYKYRFTKENMKKLIEMIKDDFDVSDNPKDANHHKNQVPVEFQIMAAIRYWGLTEHPQITAQILGVSKFTLGRICKRVANVLSTKSSRFIRMPSTLKEREKVTNDFQSIAKMPHVVGVVSHGIVRFKKYFQDSKRKVHNVSGKHNEGYFQVQLVSDASCKIRDIDCKLPAKASKRIPNLNANEIFKQSRIKERFEQSEFRGRFLLGKGGDGGLKCTNYLFTPVEEPSNAEEQAYNKSHEATLNLASECFMLWKKRFNILNSEIGTSLSLARNTVIALAVLHNMSIEWNDISLDNMSFGFSPNNSILAGLLKGSETNTRSEFIRNNF